MSRETDSSSAGANGRGGAAYPSGTPPYGTPMASEDGVDGGPSATQSEDRKTETTLTTRIRINIPGSRPIPPVVVRTPVADADGAEDAESTDDAEPTRPASTVSALSTLDSPPEQPSAPAEEKTSDWFAPRKSANKNTQGGAPANGAGLPGGSGAPGLPSGASGAPGVPGARPGGGPGGASPFGARPGGTGGAGLPGAAAAGSVAPGHGGGTGSFDVSDAVAASTASLPIIGGESDKPRPDDLAFFSDPEPGPTGPTGGPVTGDGPVVPAPGPTPGGPGRNAPGTGPGGPGGPGAAGRRRPGVGLSDDTAVLTPQKQAPGPGAHGFGGPGDDALSKTAPTGMPAVPQGARIGSFTDPNPLGAGAHPAPRPPAPAQNSAGAKPAKKKGRNKLVLLVGAVVVVAGVAYGAGLLMNHSDVPKGTSVLGVDIGGSTRDEAVQKLDAALGSRTGKPLQLKVEGKSVTLKPEQAGLQLDSRATVSAAAESDYNPVSVIGSLFGQERVVSPVIPVDQEKLQAALAGMAGGAGSMTEGTIKFESGKAVAVYGKPGKGIDAAGSTAAVQEAYRTQVETGVSAPVTVPTTTRQPTVSNAEVDRMMKTFAEPAMSGKVTVMTDAAHSVPLSPENSLWRFIGVKAIDGRLVETYDKAALQELYGHAFDDVLITRGTGQKTAVTVEDVIGALRPALLGKTAAARVGTIETDPS
ncbi:hypothetical protein [Streptomyces nodosus]|uniref:hypothetical protein n=1 Tax=Streptomyces nodosus TaxID=40318 RepID=UPI0036E2E48F